LAVLTQINKLSDVLWKRTKFAKFRSMDFIESIEKEIEAGTTAHAYLLIGLAEEGFSKTISRVLDRLKYSRFDALEIMPSDDEGKKGELKAEQVEEIIRWLSRTPQGFGKVGIIVGADRLNETAANRLLKTLEEPPKNALLILIAATENILTTIKSRCRIYRFNPVDLENHTLSYSDLKNRKMYEIFQQIEEVVKESRVGQYLDDLRALCRTQMLETQSSRWADLISEIEKTRKNIAGNANARLALENLVLKIKNI